MATNRIRRQVKSITSASGENRTTGARKTYRSTRIPERIERDTAETTYGFDFARVDNSAGKGMKKRRKRTATERSRIGDAATLLAMKPTSSGRFPYQMVRNCAKNRPAHMRLKPNIRMERSDRSDRAPGARSAGGVPRSRRYRRAETANPP